MSQIGHFHSHSLDGWTYPLSYHLPPPQLSHYPGYPMTTTTATNMAPGHMAAGSIGHQAMDRATGRSPAQPATLPLLTPMDLSRYSAAFATPALSHASLAPKHERSHSSTPPPGDIPQAPSRFGFSQSPESVPTRQLEFHPHAYRPVAAAWDPSAPRRPNEGYAFHQTYFGDGLAVHEADGYPREANGYPYAQPCSNWEVPKYDNAETEKTKNRRHVCPVCDKRFNRPSSLNTHMSVHTGAKPFQCDRPGCGRRFSVSSNLRRHEKTHINRRASMERSMSGDGLELLTFAAASTPMRPTTGHAHSHSASSFPYAYPGSYGYQPHQYRSYAQTPGAEYSSPSAPSNSSTSGSASAQMGSVGSIASMASVTGVAGAAGVTAGANGMGMGLDQYSIMSRRRKAEEMEDEVKSPLEYDTEEVDGVMVVG